METASIFEQQAQWKALRLGKFTASEIHRLLKSGKKKGELFGDGAMTYIMEKVAELITGESKPDISTLPALEHGAANEYDAVLLLQEYLGKAIEYYGVAEPKFYPYNKVSGGTPDGIVPQDAVCEIKCPYVSSNHIKYLLVSKHKEGAVYETLWLKENSAEYYAQVQFNMMCTGLKKGYFVSYDPRTLEHTNRLAVLTINADEDYQMDIKHRLEEAAKIVRANLELLK